MSNHPRTAARSGRSGGSAAYAALLLALSVLLSLLIPAGAAQAYAPAATAPDATAEVAADEDCAVLPLSGFGEAAPAEGRPTIPGDTTACFTFTAEAAGLHKVVVVGGANGSTYASVLDGGTEIDCYDPKWGSRLVQAAPLGRVHAPAVQRLVRDEQAHRRRRSPRHHRGLRTRDRHLLGHRPRRRLGRRADRHPVPDLHRHAG